MPATTVAEAPKGASRNGTTTGQAAKRRLPIETVEVAFDYLGVAFSATCWRDPPSGLLDVFFEGRASDDFKAALGRIVRAWDVVDEEGEPVPIPAQGGIPRVPYRLLWSLVTAYIDALAAPKA